MAADDPLTPAELAFRELCSSPRKRRQFERWSSDTLFDWKEKHKVSRIVIVGGPSRGKSTLADELHRKNGTPVYCGDPKSKVIYTKPYSIYLPEGLAMADGSTRFIAESWFTKPGPWICEGWIMARALRKWRDIMDRRSMPCDRIIVLDREAHRPTSKEQEAMHKGVMKVWREVADHFDRITEVRR